MIASHPRDVRRVAPRSLSERDRTVLRLACGSAPEDWIDVCDRIAGVSPPRDGGGSAAVYQRCAAVARERLAECGLTPSSGIPLHVLAQLETGLHRWLHFISGAALAAEPPAGASNRDLAAWFVARPVLARLIASIVDRWSAAVVELATRLERDRPSLAQGLFSGATPGELVSVDANLSDPHHGGRTVMRLTFDDGTVVLYKPRSAGMEAAFAGLLDWCHARGGFTGVRVPRHLTRDAYAWAEYVPHRACESWEELLEFGRSAGSLLSLASILDGTDLHDGNVVAAGPCLVPVDLETLFSPRLAADAGPTSSGRPPERDPLARTAMLPAWRVRPGEPAADIGTLGSLFASESTPSYERSPESRPFTDLDTLTTLARRAGETEDTTGLQRQLCSAVVDGFSSGCRFISVHRDALLATDSPLSGFEHQPVRWVFRDTTIYLDVLRSAIAANRWTQWDHWLAACARLPASLTAVPPSVLGPLLAAEAASLADGDVPYFQTATDSTDLVAAAGWTIAGVFAAPSFTAVRRRLAAHAEEDVATQIGSVQRALAARLAGPPPVRGRT